MKQGQNLQELTTELLSQKELKRDYIASTELLTAYYHPDNQIQIGMELNSKERLMNILPYAHGQIAARLGIPKKYYDRMLMDAPNLLCDNINTWFTQNSERRLLRTMENGSTNLRAFLSNGYRTLDNYDMMQAVLPIITSEKMKIESCNVSESKLYIKALFPAMTGTLNTGDVVQSGIVISNSEIGAGSVKIEPLTYILSCLNGMISARAMNKYHTGSKFGEGADSAFELYTDETKELSDQAFWRQVQDVTRSSINEVNFKERIYKIDNAHEDKIEGSVVAMVKEVQKGNSLTDQTGEDILKHLIEGKDLSRWGLSQAVTRTAQDVPDYDDATNMERLGGQIVEMLEPSWKKLNTVKV